MPAPSPIKGFAATLRDQLKAASDRAARLAGEVQDSVDNLHARFDDAEKVKQEIDSAAAEIHDALGGDNGGPPLSDTPKG